MVSVGGSSKPSSAAEAEADPYEQARAIVLRQLTSAPRTRAQLAAALARRNVPDDVASAVLDRFEEVELVDDEDFARTWVRSRHSGRGLARRALAHELRQRGVADDHVRDAVDEVSSEQELETARELVRRRLRTIHDDPDRAVRRLVGMLARKGYGWGTASRAVRDVLAEGVAGFGEPPGADLVAALEEGEDADDGSG